MEQTAVNWLIKNLMLNGLIRLTQDQHSLYKELTEEAKEMEKEQQIALLKFSREMCTPDAPIDYIIKEFNKYGK